MAGPWRKTRCSGSTRCTTGSSPAWSRTPRATPRSRQLPSARSSSPLRVERLVHELVSPHVVLAPHAADCPVVEAAQHLHGLPVQRLQVLLLDAVLPADLARHQLRVVDYLDVARTQLLRERQGEQDG